MNRFTMFIRVDQLKDMLAEWEDDYNRMRFQYEVRHHSTV